MRLLSRFSGKFILLYSILENLFEAKKSNSFEITNESNFSLSIFFEIIKSAAFFKNIVMVLAFCPLQLLIWALLIFMSLRVGKMIKLDTIKW